MNSNLLEVFLGYCEKGIIYRTISDAEFSIELIEFNFEKVDDDFIITDKRNIKSKVLKIPNINTNWNVEEYDDYIIIKNDTTKIFIDEVI